MDRPADYLLSGTVGQWLPVPCNGGPCTRSATRKPTRRGRLGPRAGIPKRTRPKLPPNGVLSNQRGLHQCTKGKGPENPGVVAPFAVAGCRGNRRRAVDVLAFFVYGRHSVHRQSAELPCCPSATWYPPCFYPVPFATAARIPLLLLSPDCIMSIFRGDGTPCDCRTPPVNDVGRFSELAC